MSDVKHDETSTAVPVKSSADPIEETNSNHDDQVVEDKQAAAATKGEHELTIRQALKLYPKAIGFSLLFSNAVIMEGYDMHLLGALFGFTPFQTAYGTVTNPETGDPLISAPWQSGIKNGMNVGALGGLVLNGFFADKFGYKKTMSGALIALCGFIFITFFAQGVGMILAGAMLCGLPWGIFQTLTVTYASEVAPTVLRPYLTTYVNLCWVFGQLISTGVLRGFIGDTSQWAYRVPFGIQWIWPIPILIGVYFAPESPWWLVRQQRFEDARNSLLALTSVNSGIPYDVDNQVAMIKSTDEFEKAESAGTRYTDCFKGTDLRRTEITCISWLCQSQCGSALMSYSVQFFTSAGLDETRSFDFSLAKYGMGGIGTILSWFILARVGRRTTMLWGLISLFVILAITGGLGISTNPNVAWGVGSLLMIYTFVYDITVGPACYALVADMPSTRLKIKTVVLARCCYGIGQIVNNILMPLMVLPNSWDWGALTAWYWAGMCALLITWCHFRLPEPRGRTYGEMDVLFQHKVPARKFASSDVQQFSSHGEPIIKDGRESHV